MRLDLSCPIEETRIALKHGGSAPEAVIQLYNRSTRRITGVEGVVRWGCGSGATATVVRAERLRAGARRCFELTVAAPEPDVRRAVFLPSRVSFEEDSADWLPGSGEIAEVDPLRLAVGAEREALAASLGPDAVCLASSGRETWRCVCGQASLLMRDRCSRCGRTRRQVLSWKMNAAENKTARTQSADLPSPAAEASGPLSRLRRAAALALPRLR